MEAPMIKSQHPSRVTIAAALTALAITAQRNGTARHTKKPSGAKALRNRRDYCQRKEAEARQRRAEWQAKKDAEYREKQERRRRVILAALGRTGEA